MSFENETGLESESNPANPNPGCVNLDSNPSESESGPRFSGVESGQLRIRSNPNPAKIGAVRSTSADHSQYHASGFRNLQMFCRKEESECGAGRVETTGVCHRFPASSR